ncbi:MAG: putative secreted protein [uncultured Solirubrobacteraceae bacterium]|uniref:Putative secreted protein n=1 Tax=uncultured Solirubrobacteraceae bacterium TaxID=1162706 RepID=A0A6J4SU79_9ACTN|nr:MAG: putative secreted protein [uncultured Solirubrobacteraceae bacterium]
MRRFTRLLAAGVSVVCLAVVPASALADPGEDHGHYHDDEFPVPTPSLPLFGPGLQNFSLLGLSDKDGVTNSDLAFHGNLAFAGNYDGFRIFNIRNAARPRLLADVRCRAVQSDLTVFKADNGRMYLLQSIDRAVTAPDCSGVDTPLVREMENGTMRNRAGFGWEGLRMFDVTDANNPRFVKFFRTECGSHTHTLVPDRRNGMMHAYVASYPLGSGITAEADRAAAGDLFCDAPHQKISIVDLPLDDPESGTVRTKALSSDSEPYDPDGPFDATGSPTGGPVGGQPAFIACHDHQAFMPRNIVVGSCAGDAQLWDITDRGDPTSADGEAHTHISLEPEFDFIHNAVVTWDGETVAISDESGGGGEPRCDGPNTVRGFTYFYSLVDPGDEAPELQGRYMIPRPQNTEICVSHNGITLPTTDGRHLMVQAFYQGGTSFYDFTDPAAAREIGFADPETSIGKTDAWSSYWYNGAVYVNGGLNRRNTPGGQPDGNRGFESYRLRDEDGSRVTTRRWRHLNPQTQEQFQVPDFEDEDEDEDDN